MTKTPELHGVRMMQVKSVTGATLNVLDIAPGAYGAYPSAISDKRLVEFYDTRRPHTLFGQFTGGRYYAEDLMTPSRGKRAGLALNGDISAWMISGPTFVHIIEWLNES